MADPLVVGADAEARPGWVEAHSIDEVERLVRAGCTVVVTPSELARSSARTRARVSAPTAEPPGDTGEATDSGTDPAASGGATAPRNPAAYGDATASRGAAAPRSAADDEAAELAAASVCAWLGVRVFRTARPEQVRLAVAMTESLAGRRPPALARRGLA
ncbi:hypothetical protein [Planomonospora algeriensis]